MKYQLKIGSHSQCDGTQATVAGPTRQRAPLILRVRRTAQRDRQIALRNSSVRKKKKRVKKRKTRYCMKTRKSPKKTKKVLLFLCLARD
jgi:hypothetical protein